MALKSTKLDTKKKKFFFKLSYIGEPSIHIDTNGFQMAMKKNLIARQLGASPPDPVCDAHGLRLFA